MSKSINSIFQQTLNSHHEQLAFSDYQGEDFTYYQVSKSIYALHNYFKQAKIAKGDKVILLGRNSSRWAISYIALMSYGAVVVPVLPDFKTKDFLYIIDHSDAVLLMIDDDIYRSLFSKGHSCKLPAISLNDFTIMKSADREQNLSLIDELNQENSEKKFALNFDPVNDENLGLLSYTSGTTGFSKGVMLSRKNLLSNIIYAQEHMPLENGHKICSFLPMAHIYGQLFEFIFPFSVGCHVTFLNKTPGPTLLIKAFKEIKPNLILSVPLILEKIYRNKLVPVITKPHMKLLLSIPFVKNIIHKKINEQLSENFGNSFFEMVIGGAALHKEVEDFLTKIKFRFTVGYGMTECAPLISYDGWKTSKKSAAGKIVDRMEVRIDSNDPYNEIGEIQVKGDNVTMGYYKDKDATAATFTEDGWLKTGDLGIIDRENYIFIKGRSKNMILGANGKNIYPEEIETLLNAYPIVQESIVIKEDNKLIALVYPDPVVMKDSGISNENILDELNNVRQNLNQNLAKYMHIREIRVSDVEFEKTPKKSIKRFIYT